MPVIVIGADHPLGAVVIARLSQPGREVRAFVTSPEAAERLRSTGVKVALGDISDASHVSGACLNCFSAVMIGEAARDGREISFAQSPDEVWQGWAQALTEARVRRAIWVMEGSSPPGGVEEVATVSAGGRGPADVAEEVAALDDALRLPS